MSNLKLLPIISLSLILVVIPLSGCVSGSEYEALRTEHASLVQENTNLKTELEGMQLDLTNVQADYDELKGDYDELNMEYDKLKADYDELITKYSELKGDHEIINEELAEIKEAPQSIDLITQHYAWLYGGQEWTWDVQIPQGLYEYYQRLPRPPTGNYSVYVTHPMDDTYINDLVNKIKDAAYQAGFDELQTVEFAFTFVQSLPYTPDSVTTPYDEYPRYPIETLVDNGGDCEDTSILMASLLDSMSYGVVLILLPEHCAVGVLGGESRYGTYWEYNGGKYFYLETTGTGWGVGEIPEEYADAMASVYGMTPTPILTQTWVATNEGTTVDLEVTIENLGSAMADGVYVYAGFDAGEEMLWSTQESRPFELPIDGSITVRLILEIPLHEHTRLVVQIVDDGYAVETSYSEWFDT